MSFLLSCPSCGPREYEEFRYGGELRAAPADPDDVRALSEYLYGRDNLAGVQREWWFHQSGCRQWFVAERDVRSNEVASTYWYECARGEPTEGETRGAGDGERARRRAGEGS